MASNAAAPYTVLFENDVRVLDKVSISVEQIFSRTIFLDISESEIGFLDI